MPEQPLDAIDRAIINTLQGGFPLSQRPFADAAVGLGLSEDELINRLKTMRATGILTRFGPMFQIERIGGAFCLAAMAVPADDFERVTRIVNSFPQIAHNYEREHRLNMWFVLATDTPAGIPDVVARIEEATACPVLTFPKEREYFVDLRFEA